MGHRLPIVARVVIALAVPSEWRDEIEADLAEGFGARVAGGRIAAHRWLIGQLVRLRPWALRRAAHGARPGVSPRAPGRFDGWSIDARQSIRRLTSERGFTAVVLATVALSIGATTAVFSVVNGVLLRPLDLEEPEQLVLAWQTRPEWENHQNAQLAQFAQTFPLSVPTFRDWESESTSFEAIGVYGGAGWVWQTAERAELVRGLEVSSGIFRALEVEPQLGRAFSPADDELGRTASLVLSHGMWRDRLGGDPEVVGTSMSLDGTPYVIVGVMPAGFSIPGQSAEVWATLNEEQWAERGSQSYTALGRLRAGLSAEDAQAELVSIQERLSDLYPVDQVDMRATVRPLLDHMVGDVQSTLFFLLAAVGMVLAIACLNIANMLSVSGVSRAREFAVKAALGAGGRRLVRSLVTDSLVLCGIGGALGLVGAWVALPVLVELLPPTVPRTESVALDGRVLAFAFAVTLTTALLVGLLPATHAARSNPATTMSATARGLGGGRHGQSIRAGLVITEVALAFVLLVGAGLLGTSFQRLSSVDRGFQTEGLVAMTVRPSVSEYPEPEDRAAFVRALRQELETIPGVNVSRANQIPLSGSSSTTTYYLDRPGTEPLEVSLMISVVDADYFAVAGVELVRGQLFGGSELSGTPPVAVANQALVELLWPGEDALGRQLRADEDEPQTTTVVGVVRDVLHNSLTRGAEAKLYVPVTQNHREAHRWLLRTEGDPTSTAELARAAVASVSSGTPVANVQVLDERIDLLVAVPRFRTYFVAGLAALATLLALLGVYGVVSFTVTQGLRELAVRLAIGAHPHDVVAGTVGRGVRLALGGVVIGLAIAWQVARLAPSTDFLFAVEAINPAAWAMGGAALIAVGAIAAWVPARRAARVDPVSILRAD